MDSEGKGKRKITTKRNETTGSKALALPQSTPDSSFPKEIMEHISELTTLPVPTSHDDLLLELLDKIEQVDYRERAGLEGDEKLKLNHFLIITIEEILNLSKRHNWGICRKHDFIFIYNGAFWREIGSDDLKEFLGEASERMGVDKYKARHYKFRDELLKQFLTLALFPAPHEQNNVCINLLNGTLEISKGKPILRPFNRNDFLTYQLPFEYDSDARSPIFNAFLNEVLPDMESQILLAEYLGYIFIDRSKLKLEKVLILYGGGANGKSVIFEIVSAILGEKNVSSYSLKKLTNDNGYYRAKIVNKLVNYASELNEIDDMSIFKSLITGEPIDARSPYGQPFNTKKYAKLLFNANELLRNVEHTLAFYRRFMIIPFNVTIPEERQDKELANKIIDVELPGILNWILKGMGRLLSQKKFSDCKACNLEVEEYKIQSDSVKMFVEECAYQKSQEEYVLLQELYREYTTFCNDDGYSRVKKVNFKKRLISHGILIERKNVGNVAFITKK